MFARMTEDAASHARTESVHDPDAKTDQGILVVYILARVRSK